MVKRDELGDLDPRLRFEVHLPVIGGDEQRGVGGQRVEQLADETVDEPELAGEHTVVQAELVRDRVDTRVVRVHEALPGLDRAHALLDRARPPCASPRAVRRAGAPA